MKKFFFTLLILSILVVSHSQEIPQLGAEIYLESRQTTEQVTDKMV
jgi:Na+-translocating ferredoxin:NAD+ oxidoreductase RnfG subunit